MIVTDPADLETLFGQDRETHIYGLADLEEPFWSTSTWHRVGRAAVGVVSNGGEWVTGYAMSRSDPSETLALLVEVHESLPAGSWVTGPVGLHESMSPLRPVRPVGLHWRMILDEPALDAVVLGGVAALGPDDAEAVADLYDSDPGQAFFLPSMLEHNPFVGVWEGERLVAAAGTHVASMRHRVTAVGAVITRPSHRGRGLGGVAVAGLCRILLGDYEIIGLNVQEDNTPALSVYDRLGFRRAFEYEEIELV